VGSGKEKGKPHAETKKELEARKIIRRRQCDDFGTGSLGEN